MGNSASVRILGSGVSGGLLMKKLTPIREKRCEHVGLMLRIVEVC